jgi:hypothetical protein
MFEKLFGKESDVVHHKIAPSTFTLTEVWTPIGLASRTRRPESKGVRSEAGFQRGARDYGRVFLRVATRWLLFVGHLRSAASRPRPHAALVDDFMRWMTEERGLSVGTVMSQVWRKAAAVLRQVKLRGRRTFSTCGNEVKAA